MKDIVINTNYGGFEIPEELMYKIGAKSQYDDSEEVRTHPLLINYVENHPIMCSLKIVHIPDEVTDYRIDEYDGLESVIAVIDGKIVDLDYDDSFEEEAKNCWVDED